MALREIHFDVLNSPLVDLAHHRELVLDPPYQRASVWTISQRQHLIKSLLQGLPVGAVFTNERDDHLFVVDGKQRLETIRLFLANAFQVPARWFPARSITRSPLDDLVWWDGLSVVGQRVASNHWTVAQYRTSLRTEKGEMDLYHRINYGGTPHKGD